MPVQILMPALSPTMGEGNLVKWHKKEGDIVKAGQVLAEIETDKATMEVEAVDEGILGRIMVAEGTENVPVNAVIGVLLEEGEDSSALDKALEDLGAPVSSESASPSLSQEVHQGGVAPSKPFASLSLSQDRVMATPLARRIAQQKNINLKEVPGSGPRGRIIKKDIEDYGGGRSGSLRAISQGSFPGDELLPPYERVTLTNVRKVIAQRLTEAKQTVPHFYLTVDCELDALMRTRQEINKTLEERGRLSINDFVIKAVAMSLKKVPQANTAWAEDHIKLFERADISVAVASEAGLITPIIRGADQKSLGEISQEMKELAAKARAGKLKPHEFQGGTFSLSNLGMYGVKSFSAIINPPQGCILAVGAGQPQAVIREGRIEVATLMSCTLSLDHRAVDGAVGAQFLKHFQSMIACPMMMGV